MEKECFLLDVFTDRPFTGNQLAVFPFADDLTSAQMQKLANEINYSETTFILEKSDSTADRDVRIFTPQTELPFAGHPTLGTAYALLNLIDSPLKNKNQLILKTQVGNIRLARSGEHIRMRQNDPEFFNIYRDKREIAKLVGLTADDIADDWPMEEVSTGNSLLMVPVKGLSAIGKAVGNMNRLIEFFKQKSSIAPYLFTLDTIDSASKIHTRMFAPHLGIIEDPATGSAAGPLTGYLLKHGVFGDQFEIQNEQGIEMGRPSKILMKGSIVDGRYRIEIGGNCYYIGESAFRL
jgi:trans-2,3-dihydro-3-hydroxyanthranilate isomerase